MINLRRTDIRASIDNTNEDTRADRVIADAVVFREEDVSTVGTSLVPTLDSSTD